MEDTPAHVKKLRNALYQKMSLEEKFKAFSDLQEFAKELVKSSIKE